MTFSQDANRLVLAPIERMISKLDEIRNNPLEAMTIADEEHHRGHTPAPANREDSKQINEDDVSKSCCRRCLSCVSRCLSVFRFKGTISEQVPEPMETVVLEKTIMKIRSLLALGFGEAGAEIIGQNMRG